MTDRITDNIQSHSTIKEFQCAHKELLNFCERCGLILNKDGVN
jgi:hypothetical protein